MVNALQVIEVINIFQTSITIPISTHCTILSTVCMVNYRLHICELANDLVFGPLYSRCLNNGCFNVVIKKPRVRE